MRTSRQVLDQLHWTLSFNSPDVVPTNIPATLSATVPGCVHTDLIAAGLIDDITIDGREVDQAWIARANSVYETTVPQPQNDAEHHELVFRGLDTIAKVFINGQQRLSARNMHRSYRLDVTKDFAAGPIDVRVEFSAPLNDAEALERELGAFPNPYNLPYNFQRKMACSYGWDWGPVTITSGIWKPVELHSWSHAALEQVALVPNVKDGVPVLSVQPQILGASADLQLHVVVRDGAHVLLDTTVPAASKAIVFELPEARIWWPRGFGDQVLHDVEIELISGAEVIDVFSKRVGFRSVSLDTSAIDAPDGEHMFAIHINGQRVWMTGANWIPDDPFPHRVTRERYEARLADARDVSIMALRVWGGGLYESDDFYEIADREGLLVWQDFLFACAAYPETEEMFREVEAEARENIARLSSHPSLMLWCGGNECIEGYHYWGWQEPLAGKPWGESFYLKLLPSIVAQLDGTRPYIPGSPISTITDDVRDFRSGTSHIWDVWNELSYTRYEEYRPAFAAEFGFNGPGGWQVLTKSIGKDILDSADEDLIVHQKAFNGMRNIARQLKEEYARDITEGPMWYFATQLQQSRAVTTGLKHFHSLYERCSGTLLWQFNDMWPAISWAVLDSSGHRKLAWYAMRDAYIPRMLHWSRIDHGGVLTVLNDTKDSWESTLVAELFSESGDLIGSAERPISLAPRTAVRFTSAELFGEVMEGFAVATVGEHRSTRRLSTKPASVAPQGNPTVTVSRTPQGLDVTVTTTVLTHDMCFLSELATPDARVDSQLITLKPGESHTFHVQCSPAVSSSLEKDAADLVWSHNRVVNA